MSKGLVLLVTTALLSGCGSSAHKPITLECRSTHGGTTQLVVLLSGDRITLTPREGVWECIAQ